MFSHSDIWDALDRLAQHMSTSPSGLAKQAGLDPTTFNKSKRKSGSKQRWPSTESLSKVLAVVEMSFEDFARFAGGMPHRGPAIPLTEFIQAEMEGFFDNRGFPKGGGWDDLGVPGLQTGGVYALQIVGDSMSPVFRSGDKILVAPHETIRDGDRVVVKTRDGVIMAREVLKQTAHSLELMSFNPEYDDLILPQKDVDWVARIVWVSQ